MSDDTQIADIWAQLHDATLRSIRLDWKEGVVDIVVHKQPEGGVLISASGASELRCERKHPWGRSASINEVRRGVESHGSSEFLEIEMQSGDLIRVEARSFFLRLTSGDDE